MSQDFANQQEKKITVGIKLCESGEKFFSRGLNFVNKRAIREKFFPLKSLHLK